MISSIQFLRALAAVMVLVFHACYMVNAFGGYVFEFNNAGAAGVDIFFVISGFIITYVTRNSSASPLDFMMRRLIRIAPPYWFYSLITVFILVAIPGAFSHLKFEPVHVLSSSLFILSENNDHVVGTVLGVGWTVCYEFYFYLLFAVFMLAPKRFVTVGLSSVIILGALCEQILPVVPPFASVAVSALPLEFLAGCFLAKLYIKRIYLPGSVATIAIIFGIVAIYYAGVANVVAREQEPWRVIYFGLPAICLTAGFLSLEARGLFRAPRWILAIGDASYSLYLSHQFVLVAVGKLWVLLGLQLHLPVAFLLITGIILPILAAVILYYCTEKPVTRWLVNQWQRARVSSKHAF